MGSGEGFKDYTQKWRDLVGRVQPPLCDRELVDMFLGTLSGPFLNHLIGSSSVGFTALILTGERVEVGIRSGKIKKDTSLIAGKRPFVGKKEVSASYSQRNQGRTKHRPTVWAVMISKPAATQQQNNKPGEERSMRQFTLINMTLSQVLPHFLKSNLVTLREAPKNPNTISPNYNPKARRTYNSKSPGHDTKDF